MPNVILTKSNETALRHWFSPVNLMCFLKSPFNRNTSGEMLLYLVNLQGCSFKNETPVCCFVGNFLKLQNTFFRPGVY